MGYESYEKAVSIIQGIKPTKFKMGNCYELEDYQV